MKKWMKKLLVGALSVLTFVCGGVAALKWETPTAKTSAAEIPKDTRVSEGLSFAHDNTYYEVDSELTTMPKTFEAYVKPTSVRQFAIIGGYRGSNALGDYVYNFEINQYMEVRLYYVVNGATKDVTFSDNNNELYQADGTTRVCPDVKANTWQHIAVTHEGTNMFLYINGTLVGKRTGQIDMTDVTTAGAVRIGRDFVGGDRSFKGNIKGIKLYSDVRTATEVAADYGEWVGANAGKIDVSDDDILCAYDFTQGGAAYLHDLSANGYDINYTGDDTNGFTFAYNEIYEVSGISSTPQTFEAEIFVPTTQTARAGIVLGNYAKTGCFDLEIHQNGKPRLYYTSTAGTKDLYFNTDVRTGDWVHLAITCNQETGVFTCYVNGDAVATVAGTAYGSICPDYLIGGDYRGTNDMYFKGLIRSISLYSDVRTAAEVQSDYKNGTSTTADNLLAHYNMPKSGARADVKDLSGNGKDADFYITWFEDKAEVTGYEYSLALVGDTQIINERDMMNGTTVMDGLYQWIVDNAQSKKMAQVIGLGDITDSGDYSDQEWDHALATISKLDEAGIPYTLIRGNHDETGKYNEHFGFGSTSGYLEQFTKAEYYGFYKQDKIESSFKTFTAGSTEYLILTLDYGADDAELAWAGSVIESFPNHKVIITTHAYMYIDGTRISLNDGYVPSDFNDWNADPEKVYNNGDQMWEKLVSQYGNIFLVLSGHESYSDVVTLQSKGVHGNTVTQMLIDPQDMDATMGGCAMVCMLYFSQDGSKMEVEWYSTHKNKYYREKNQYVVDISNAPVDVHAYAYDFDKDEHWQVCECGEMKDFAAHELGEWTPVREVSATQSGKLERSCVCGYTETKILTAYSFGNEFGASIRASEPNGMRFRLQISSDVKNAIFADGNKTLGMFIFPADKLAAANGDYASVAKKINITFTQDDLYQVGDLWYANGVIADMYIQNLTKTFIGVGYIATQNGETTSYVYSTFNAEENARSLYYVAKVGYTDPAAAQYKQWTTKFIEQSIYAAYGIKENRQTVAGSLQVTFTDGKSTWASYEEMKAANPITIDVGSGVNALAIGEGVAFAAKVKVNGIVVDLDVPFEYAVSQNAMLKNGVLTAKEAGEGSVTVSFGGYQTTYHFLASTNAIDGLLLDGVRDEAYGAFSDTTDLSNGKWYSISAVKTENGVFLYTQAMFGTAVIGDKSNNWITSTNFRFKLNTFKGETDCFVNMALQSYGVDAFVYNVEEQGGKYLHTAEIFVSKQLVVGWEDDKDVQLNYLWNATGDTAETILDDVIVYNYIPWDTTTVYAYHRLGGMWTNFNPLVDNLQISENGLVDQTSPLSNVTIDGVLSSEEQAMYGANELDASGAGSSINVKTTVIDGDLYMAITIVHGEWSAYTAAWAKNDNVEITIDGKQEAIVFFDGKLSLPAYYTDGACTTVEVDGQLVTVIELYKKGDKQSYTANIWVAGNGFGSYDVCKTSGAVITASGIVKN